MSVPDSLPPTYDRIGNLRAAYSLLNSVDTAIDYYLTHARPDNPYVPHLVEARGRVERCRVLITQVGKDLQRTANERA
jgi:hypothetical protein